MIPILFEIDPFCVGSYGVMLALAFLITGWLLGKEFQRKGLATDWVYSIIVGAAISGIIGARIYFIFENWSEFWRAPLSFIFTGYGLTWYGGFIGGFVAVLWIIRKIPAPALEVVDIIAPFLLLGYGIGRIGCLLSGDGDYGPPTDLPWGMAFPNGLVPTPVPVHPTPIYETLLSLAFFFILWRLRYKIKTTGLMLSGMLILYGIERFVTEFWRLTPKVLWGWMSMAQILSVVSIIAGIVFGWSRVAKNHANAGQKN
jgi:phosphatidylglycerol:prolipoprotein diacylglycerol transferase